MTDTAIRDTSDTLRTLLERNLPSGYSVSTTLPQSAGPSTGEHAVNLYLYLIVEHAFSRNRPPSADGTHRYRRGPLGLTLYYMMTPHNRDGITSTDDHLVLGQAMRVFYDHPVITDSLLDASSNPILQGELRGRGTELHIVLNRLNLEEQIKIWNALQTPYRLSVCYEVRTVRIDSELISEVGRAEIVEMHYGHQV
jgi:hypothetical protein